MSKKKKRKGKLPAGLAAYMAKQKALKAGANRTKLKAPKAKGHTTPKTTAKPIKRKKPRRSAKPLYTNTGVAGIVPPVPEKRLSEPSQAETRPLY